MLKRIISLTIFRNSNNKDVLYLIFTRNALQLLLLENIVKSCKQLKIIEETNIYVIICQYISSKNSLPEDITCSFVPMYAVSDNDTMTGEYYYDQVCIYAKALF